MDGIVIGTIGLLIFGGLMVICGLLLAKGDD